ncbi:MAG TPA: ATP-binding protein, partial [Pyrinomonadaceae bacterium]|nr:ATP-binding protein [Pyrinomonadaceae bacterium]
RGPDGRPAGMRGVTLDISARKLAEAAVRESEQQYRHLADAMPQIVWTARADGFTEYFNRRWSEYTGLTLEQTLGWGWQHVIHPDDAERAVRRWARSIEAGEDFEIEYRFRRSDGTYRWHLGRAEPMRDAEGRVLRWFGTSTDIEDQKRTEGALRFLAEAEAVLASSLDFERTLESVARLAVPTLADFCLVDMVGDAGQIRRMVVAHSDPSKEERWREMQRRFPVSPDDPHSVPKVLRTGRPELYRELTDERVAAALRGRADADEQVHAFGELGVKSAMIVPLAARGRVIGALSFVSAESGRRYTPHDLAFAEDLARRAAAAIDNAQLYQRTEQANRTKDEFLATLSHELRTPLTPIMGWVHMLRTGRVRGDEDVAHGLDVMERNSQALARLINDLLDMSAIISGKMRIERAPVALRQVLREAVETARAEAERRGAGVSVELSGGEGEDDGDGDAGPLVVSGDRTRLRQIFSNLLNNAVKFSTRGGRVRVSLRAEGGEARVEVSDEGLGIAPEFLPHVFERFRQEDSSTTRAHGGLGLGLALVKSFVEAHGGTVRA